MSNKITFSEFLRGLRVGDAQEFLWETAMCQKGFFARFITLKRDYSTWFHTSFVWNATTQKFDYWQDKYAYYKELHDIRNDGEGKADFG